MSSSSLLFLPSLIVDSFSIHQAAIFGDMLDACLVSSPHFRPLSSLRIALTFRLSQYSSNCNEVLFFFYRSLSVSLQLTLSSISPPVRRLGYTRRPVMARGLRQSRSREFISFSTRRSLYSKVADRFYFPHRPLELSSTSK